MKSWWLCTILFLAATASAQPKPTPIVTVSLELESVVGARAYQIEIRSEGFLKTFDSKKPLFSVQIPLGEHQIRGRSQDLRGVFGEWSESMAFSVVPQKVDLRSSVEKFKPMIKINNYKAWVQLNWTPIIGVKKYRFYLKDNTGKVLTVHESSTAHVAFLTRPGNYQYNVTAVYSGNVESDPCEFQPTLTISGRKLDPPIMVSSADEELKLIFRAKADREVGIWTKVEYSPFLGDTWDPLDDKKTGPTFLAKNFTKPGRYRLGFRTSLPGYTDSDPVQREFIVKPQEAALEPVAR